jgi:hypothetical protein
MLVGAPCGVPELVQPGILYHPAVHNLVHGVAERLPSREINQVNRAVRSRCTPSELTRVARVISTKFFLPAYTDKIFLTA